MLQFRKRWTASDLEAEVTLEARREKAAKESTASKTQAPIIPIVLHQFFHILTILTIHVKK